MRVTSLLLASLLLALVLVNGVSAECKKEDKCTDCMKERWGLLDIEHCGYCHDTQECTKGKKDGIDEGSCANWEWYGDAPLPGNECCSSATRNGNCTVCLHAKPTCEYCFEKDICYNHETIKKPLFNCSKDSTTAACCHSLSDCQTCNENAPECEWCGSTSSCIFAEQRESCAEPSPGSCCLVADSCASCKADASCVWCDSSIKCIPESAVEACLVPDADCCKDNADCASCAADGECGWCLESPAGCLPPASHCSAQQQDPKCCSTMTSCGQCNAAGSGCAWCMTAQQCLPEADQSCAGGLDPSCCEDHASCSQCVEVVGACNWCDKNSKCLPTSDHSCDLNLDNTCCNEETTCGECSTKSADGCQWCLDGVGCQKNRQTLQCNKASTACCEIHADCKSCNGAAGCLFCTEDNKCHPSDSLCNAPADPFCCDATPGTSCSECLDIAKQCSFCTQTASCTAASCDTTAVTNVTAFMCANPTLLACEGRTDCASCLAVPGCAFILDPDIDGIPLGHPLCYTGSLSAIHNKVFPGYVLTATSWYYGSCTMTAQSIVILIGVLVGAFVVSVIVGVLVCMIYRKLRARRGYNQLLNRDAEPTMANKPRTKRKKKTNSHKPAKAPQDGPSESYYAERARRSQRK